MQVYLDNIFIYKKILKNQYIISDDETRYIISYINGIYWWYQKNNYISVLELIKRIDLIKYY